MNDNYSKARGYAYKVLKGQYHVDVVHDAFLAYYLKKRKNLFDEPLWFVLKVMRDSVVNYLRKKEGRGQYKRLYIPIDDFKDSLLAYNNNLEADHLLETLSQSLSPSDVEVLNLEIEGYTSKEIGEKVGLTRSGVDFKINKARKILRKLLRD